ncbi:DrmE family protein [Natrinema sp. CGMCC1.2065]|uniref:DrmE family protein n=1 Tax=Natrinema sp. CGMCC1.2065 TaxID=3445767 RepID=UPI003F4A0D7B
MVDSQELFDAARDTDLFDMLESGRIEFEGSPLQLGHSERALLQYTLNGITEREVTFVVSPIQDDLYPLLSCFAYQILSQADSNRFEMNDVYPSLLCAKRGYLSRFASFHRSDSTNKRPIMRREPLTPSEFNQRKPTLYSTQSPEDLEYRGDEWLLGNVFVDLRNEKWRSNLSKFSDFNDHHQVCSYTFFVDIGWAAREVRDKLPDALNVNREWVMDVEPPTKTVSNPSPVRRYETILDSDFDIEYLILNDETFVENLESLYRLHKQIETEYDGYVRTGRLFKELSALAALPAQFDAAAGLNYGQPKLERLIEAIEERAAAASGSARGLLGSFADDAREILEYLSENNLKRSTFHSVLDDAAESSKPVTVVSKNETHKTAIKTDFEQSARSIPANVSIKHANEIKPMPSHRLVMLGLMPYTANAFNFPLSPDLKILCYPTEYNPIKNQLNMSTEDSPTDSSAVSGTVTKSTVNSDSDHGTVSFDLDDITESISEDILEQRESTSTVESSDGRSCDPDMYLVTFDNRLQESFRGGRRLTTYNESTHEVEKRPVRKISAGDAIVRLGDAEQDLYEYLREKEKSRGSLGDKEQLVEYWRDILRAARKESSLEDIQATLAEQGSSIESTSAIRLWISGETTGPQDPEDVRRVLEAYQPDALGVYDEINAAIEWIRKFNEEVGEEIRKMLAGELDSRKSLDVGGDVRQRIIQLREEIEVVQVEDVRKQ